MSNLVGFVVNTEFSCKICSSTEKLKAMKETVKALSQTVNQSNAVLTAQVLRMSQRLATLEKQGIYTVKLS